MALIVFLTSTVFPETSANLQPDSRPADFNLDKVKTWMLAHFPSRFKLSYVLMYALLLCTLELLQGSDPYCVGCIFVFILIAGDAFNRCGGLIYPSGSYIFFFSILAILAGATWKVFLWEPLDGNLLAPQLTFTVYTVGTAAIWVAALVNARIRSRRPLLKAEIPAQYQIRAAMGCLAIGIALDLMGPLLRVLGLQSILAQLNAFYALATMLAVYYRVRQTNGEKSFSGVAFSAWFIGFLIGLLSFSKEGLFTPFAAWGFGALAAGYKTSWKQIGILGTAAVALSMVLVPYSQYGRTHRDEFSNPFEVMALMVTDPQVFTEKNTLLEENEANIYKFYDQPQGLMDRLTMLTLDDPLILRSSMGHYEGWDVLKNYLVNSLPRFILPDKPTLRYGNVYGHEVGVLSPDDQTTSISFSPVAEAFHMAGWLSLVIVLPILLLILFVISDSLVGSLRNGPWALLFILLFSHAAPEGGFGATIYLASYGVAKLVFSIVMATRVAPVIGSMLMGPGKAPLQPRNNMRPSPLRRLGT
ncbi:MAG: hypothetical protein JSS87_05675 [Acidobacteria bacterium]|nr:hypothetical protein [Acidobacteriota bacterium]